MLPYNIEHQEFVPPEELSNTIKCFWYNTRELGDEGGDFEVIPDGFAEIIFHFGYGCCISHNGLLQSLPSPFIIGLLNQPVVFYSRNCFEVIGIRCFPWTVFDLLGLRADSDSVLLIEHPILELQPILSELIGIGKIEDAIDLVKSYFIKLQTGMNRDNRLLRAGSAMQQSKGTLPVSDVANAAHTTIRTLERKFKESSGHSVKDISAIMRFEQVRNHLWLDPKTNLAGLAHELGYTDQSHMSREFKRYSGISPAAFARNAGKDKQAIAQGIILFSTKDKNKRQ